MRKVYLTEMTEEKHDHAAVAIGMIKLPSPAVEAGRKLASPFQAGLMLWLGGLPGPWEMSTLDDLDDAGGELKLYQDYSTCGGKRLLQLSRVDSVGKLEVSGAENGSMEAEPLTGADSRNVAQAGTLLGPVAARADSLLSAVIHFWRVLLLKRGLEGAVDA